ncbi:acyl-CoA thioesterase [Zunongwangia sp. H14]|uniref:acyl-CoA thioesterase n=1 Tax=Zunongwangia sp. H14 TaxID=3240792 RepID=UPI003566CA4B
MASNPDVFEQKIQVKPEHLDEQQHVNNVQYVQWVQDVARAHWLKKSTLKQQEEFFWVVVEHQVKYKQQAFLDEELILQTYIGDTTHVTSVRHVNIKNARTGKLLVEAKTTWCLMNQETKKISKISEELKQVFLK